jgi:2-amino-4-hydroxy-6-hydroxymethyldihydropteridine diphosphokinase
LAVAYLGLGANLGDRAANMRNAVRMLGRLSEVTSVSSLYETDPVGPEQPRFYNAACKIETDLSPREVLALVKEIEREVGRSPGGERWGPREIDIDILLFGDQVVDENGLAIPHPRMLERGFVMVPLAEIAADVRFPGREETIGELAANLGQEGVREVAEVGWEKAGGV